MHPVLRSNSNKINRLMRFNRFGIVKNFFTKYTAYEVQLYLPVVERYDIW